MGTHTDTEPDRGAHTRVSAHRRTWVRAMTCTHTPHTRCDAKSLHSRHSQPDAVPQTALWRGDPSRLGYGRSGPRVGSTGGWLQPRVCVHICDAYGYAHASLLAHLHTHLCPPVRTHGHACTHV